ncbi:MAG: EpsG family protein [Peptostreptococcaceae bacterium]|nr:EpsG family protein [Peptostreptococcaceae bacterium]
MFSSIWGYNHETILLYIIIVLFTTLFASMSQSKIITGTNNVLPQRVVYRFPFFISFFILVFFSCTTAVGIDRSAYAQIFRISSFGNLQNGIEPGYHLLMIIIKIFTKNENVFLGIVAFITVAFVYKGIWDCRHELSIGFAVFIFSSQYYFQSYNLMRMYFAMSFLIAGVKLLLDGKYLRYLVLILFALCVHYSMIFVLIAYVISLIFIKIKRVSFDMKFFLSILVVVIFNYFSLSLAINLLGTSNFILDKYSMYLKETVKSGLGLKWIFNLIPYSLLLPFAKYTNKKQLFLSIAAGYLLVTLVISIVSYSIPVIGRTLACLNMPIVIMLPIAFNSFKIKRIIRKASNVVIRIGMTRIRISYRVIYLFIYIYYAFAFLLYLDGYVGRDGIDNFQFIWN